MAAVAVPAPEKSAAPMLMSKMLSVNTINTVNGIVSINVGTMETCATNQDCFKNSRHANGGLNIKVKASSDMAKNSPIERSGLAAAEIPLIGDHPRRRL
ncbi:hypothetical protein MSAS_43190 [Mycobacterium saskatchewanense]|nr:hypothetical protein MSAS_43190 [Mycobacterium saskatchewanense]